MGHWQQEWPNVALGDWVEIERVWQIEYEDGKVCDVDAHEGARCGNHEGVLETKPG